MNRYNIDGTEYIAHGDRLYLKGDEEHGVDSLTKDTVYLWNEKLVKPDNLGEIFDTIKFISLDDTCKNELCKKTEFEGAIPLETIVPEDILECPDCGSWAGPISEPDSQYCINCGWNIPDN